MTPIYLHDDLFILSVLSFQIVFFFFFFFFFYKNNLCLDNNDEPIYPHPATSKYTSLD